MCNTRVNYLITKRKSHPSHCWGVCKDPTCRPPAPSTMPANYSEMLTTLRSPEEGRGDVLRSSYKCSNFPPTFTSSATHHRYVVNKEESVRREERPGCARVLSPEWRTSGCSDPHICNSQPIQAQVTGHRVHKAPMTLQPSTVASPVSLWESQSLGSASTIPHWVRRLPFFVTSVSPKELKLNAFRHKGSCTEPL